MSTAREEILRRIRTALDDRDQRAAPASAAPEHPGATAARAAATRAAATRVAAAARAPDLARLFAERVADYRARVEAGPDVRRLVAAACERHRVERLAVPAGVPPAWRPDGIEVVPVATDPDIAELDAVDGVLTSCAAAIAETGTIVLDAGPGQGPRAATLLPDLHICVVEHDRIVADVPAALAILAHDPGRPTTFISGPSATSDIELERVEGVHGPRRLEVLLPGI